MRHKLCRKGSMYIMKERFNNFDISYEKYQTKNGSPGMPELNRGNQFTLELAKVHKMSKSLNLPYVYVMKHGYKCENGFFIALLSVSMGHLRQCLA